MQRTEIGAHPTEEIGVSPGHVTYAERSCLECMLYRAMLELAYPVPEHARFAIELLPNGTRTVIAKWLPGNLEHALWAFKAEEGLPNWSQHAENRLGISSEAH